MHRQTVGPAIMLCLLCLLTAPARGAVTELISVPGGGAAPRESSYAAVSADGRFVVFESYASGDFCGALVRDRWTSTTEYVSLNLAGQPEAAGCQFGISADGRFVAYTSWADTIVAGDTNSELDVFVYDRTTGTTERVSVASDGTQANGVSALWDLAMSADGRYVAFESGASNLVAGDTNGWWDMFVHDRVTATTERVNVSSAGEEANSFSCHVSLSGDGRYVAFMSCASNLVSGDFNGAYDVFVRDRLTGTTERVSLSSDGEEANSDSCQPSISDDGRYVAFVSLASNLVPGDTNAAADVFVYDRATRSVERVSVATSGVQGDADSKDFLGLSLSADGRYVAFPSAASNLVPDDTNAEQDIFVRDRLLATTERVSVSSDGVEANGGSWGPSVSAGGQAITFASEASNLVPNDTNLLSDVFARVEGPSGAHWLWLSRPSVDAVSAIDPVRYYVVYVDQALPLTVTVDKEGTWPATVCVSRAGLPAADAYDVRSYSEPGDQVLVLPPSAPGFYYISVSGCASYGGYTITARLPLTLASVSPSAVGNAGLVTLQLVGAGFEPATAVSAHRSDDPAVSVGASGTTVYGHARMLASLDFGGAPVGSKWDVIVQNPDGSSAELPQAITLTEALPDLYIASLAFPSYLPPGYLEPAALSLEVHNNGTLSAGATDIVIRLSPDAQIGADDLELTTMPCPSLAGGEAQALGTSVTVPSDLAPGLHYLGAVVDASGAIDELDETNNTRVRLLSVATTDLALSGLSAVRAGGWDGTGPVSVSFTVTNGSRVRSPATQVAFYASPDALISTDDVLLALQDCGSLDGGSSQAGGLAVTLPEGVSAGDSFVGAIVDPFDAVPEAREDNNARSAALRRLQDGPPLVADSDQALSVTVTSAESVAFPVQFPEGAANLFVTLRKEAPRYGAWYAELSLFRDGVVVAAAAGTGDHILHVPSPAPGSYIVVVTGAGSGRLAAYTSLPELPLGEWVIGTILRQGGNAWYQVTVPPEQTELRLAAEMLGLYSRLEVTPGDLIGPPVWSASGTTMSLTIPSPAPGIYYVELYDSAWVAGQASQWRDHMICASATPVIPPAPLSPIITSITPTTGGTSGPVTVTVIGQALDPAAAVLLRRDGCSDIAAPFVTGSDDRRTLAATFDLSAAELGEWALVVTNPDTATAISAEPFTVEAGGEPELWVEILGRAELRVGRWQTYTVKYGNPGTVNAAGASILINAPRSVQAQVEVAGVATPLTYAPGSLPPDYMADTAIIEAVVPNLAAGEVGEVTYRLYTDDLSRPSLALRASVLTHLVTGGVSGRPTSVSRLERRLAADGPTEIDVSLLDLSIWDPFGNEVRSTTHLFVPADGGYYTETNGQWTYWSHSEYTALEQSLRDSIESPGGLAEGEVLELFGPGILAPESTIWHRTLQAGTSEQAEAFYDAVRDALWDAVPPNGCNFFPDENFFEPFDIGGPDGIIAEWAEWEQHSRISSLLEHLDISWVDSATTMDRLRLLMDGKVVQYVDDPLAAWLWQRLVADLVTSLSPEDKYGPTGYDAEGTPADQRQHWVPSDRALDYRIDFWNRDDAPAATLDVYIADQLDPDVDPSTFAFTEVGFLDWSAALEPCQTFDIEFHDVTIDLAPYYPDAATVTMTVSASGVVDTETGEVRWEFHAFDPATGEVPEYPRAGFLPPITDAGWEVGWVGYTVAPLPALPSGTRIENQCWVTFDLNPPNPAPPGGPFVNTLDAGGPTSAVQELAPSQTELTFPVTWAGQDDAGGSGVRGYDIWVSDNDGPFAPWLTDTGATSSLFTGEDGHHYAFYSVAHDNVGHVEAAPTQPDATTTVALPVTWTLTAVADPPEGGMVTGSGVYGDGVSAPVSATASPGWEFTGWSGPVADPASANTTVLMDADRSVTAHFSWMTWTLSAIADPVEGGTVTGGGVFEDGTLAPVAATANAGWQFTGWTGPVAEPASAATTVLMDGDKAVTAHFSRITWTLVVIADPAEGGTVTGAGVWNDGVLVPVTATPSAGWEFIGWTGPVADPDAADTTVLMDSDKSVTAHFAALSCTLSLSGEGGSVTVDGVLQTLPWSGQFGYGATVTLQAEADEHMRFDGWSGDLECEDNPLILSMDRSWNLAANFSSIEVFSDVDRDFWAAREIAACYHAGIVQGYWDNTYRPEEAVNRAQMAVYVARAIAIPTGDEGVPEPAEGTQSFTDVAADHWAYRYVEYCSAQGIVQGYPGGAYHPDEVVNRGQMAVYVARAVAGGDGAVPEDTDGATFTDVTETTDWAWCYRYVEYCAAHGVVQGYWDGTYRPGNEVTRDQMAVYVARAFELPM